MRDIIKLTIPICIILFSSCTSERYNMLYEVNSKEKKVKLEHEDHIPTIKEGHELCITVTSINEESAKYFRTSREREGATGIECLYYKVDENGEIEIPLLGTVAIEGLTLLQVEDTIAAQLEYLIKEPKVRAEFVEYRVSVMGEVTISGVFDFPNGRVTLFEAIARAGGIGQFGRRDNVLIIREQDDGLKHIRFDLTGDDIWKSEYYYLHHNDLILVSSNNGRIANSENIPAYGSILVGLGTIAAIIATR